jgi:hypothetical protein
MGYMVILVFEAWSEKWLDALEAGAANSGGST